MKKKNKCLLAVVLSSLWMGCGTVKDFWADPHTKHFIHGAKGKDLLLVRIDQAAKEIEEFGTAGMAAPVVALPDERFAFGLEESAKTYYDNARSGVQLGVAQSLENLNSARGGIQVQADIGQLLAAQAGLAQFSAALDAASELGEAGAEELVPPEFPTAATAAGTSPAMPSGLLPDLKRLRSIMTNSGNLLPMGGLLPDQFDPTLSDRDAILIAHQSKVVQGLLDFIGNPALKKELDGKVYLFGVTTVSVAPGHRTESGYAASIDCIAGYQWRRTDHQTAVSAARSLVADGTLNRGFRAALAQEFLNTRIDWPENSIRALSQGALVAEGRRVEIPHSMQYGNGASSSAPFILPVTPLIDSQVLDLSMSRRRYQEFAQRLALTAVFASSQAATDSALEFIEVLQEDARGKSLNISVSAFSYSGGEFWLRDWAPT